MGAPAGNDFWTQRSKHGRKAIFVTPEKLWEAACEYFQWCVENPIEDPRSFGQRKVQRPFTIQGLSRYLGCNSSFWRDFKGTKTASTEDFSSIIKTIEDVIYQQKFENAALGIYKDNIIARDLGLTDKSATEHSGGLKVESTIKVINTGSGIAEGSESNIDV